MRGLLKCRSAWLAVVVVLACVACAPGGQRLIVTVSYRTGQAPAGVSEAVVVEGHALAHTTQILPLDKAGQVVGEGSADAQLAQALFNLETALAAAGSGLEQLVKVNFCVDGPKTADAVMKLLGKRFPGPVRPAVSWVATPLTNPKALLALDAVAAVTGRRPERVVRQRCDALAGEPGATHVAVLPQGEAVYVSGHPEKGELGAATAKTMAALAETLGSLKLDLAAVVQLKVFMQPIAQADVVRQEIVKAFAGQTVPPVVFVQWSGSAAVEIELVAFAPPGTAPRPPADTVSYFTPPKAKPSPVFSRVARVHGPRVIYLSGLYSEAAGSGEAQVRSLFASLGRVLHAAGSDLKHLVKATYYCTDEDASTALNKLRPEFYDPQRPPAASKALVQGVGLSGRSVTMDMIAVPPP